MAKPRIDRGTIAAQYPEMSKAEIDAYVARLEQRDEVTAAHEALAAADLSAWPEHERRLWERTLNTQRTLMRNVFAPPR